MFSFSLVFSSPRLLWEDWACAGVCIWLCGEAFLTSRSLFTRVLRVYSSMSFSLYHFTLGNKAFLGGVEQWYSLLCHCKTFFFFFFFVMVVVGGTYFISRISRGLQPQILPFVGGQLNVSASRITHSRRPHSVGEVHPCFSAISFSVSLLPLLLPSLLTTAAASLLHS